MNFFKKSMTIIVMVIFLFLFSFIVSANTEYYQTGGNAEGTFKSGSGNFDNDVSISTYSTLMSSRTNFSVPKVGDLDGDGKNELVVLQGSTLYLYNITRLFSFEEVVDTSLSNVQGDFQLFDLDDDGLQEIIIASTPSDIIKRVYMIDYNGTHLIENNIANLTYASINDSSMDSIKCYGGLCGISNIYCDFVTGGGDGAGDKRCNADFYVFDGLGNITRRQIVRRTGGEQGECYSLPIGQLISAGDLDGDSYTDWVVNYVTLRGAYGYGTTDALIETYEATDITGTLILNRVSTKTWERLDYASLVCEDGSFVNPADDLVIPDKDRSFISSPLITNAVGSTAGDNEIVFGIAEDIDTDSNDYELVVYDDELVNQLNDHPLSNNVEGDFMSPPFESLCFPDATQDSYAIMIFTNDYSAGLNTEEELIICGSSRDTYDWVDTAVYDIDIPNFNATPSVEAYVHSGQMEAGDLDEIISSLGIFSLDSCLIGACETTSLIEMPNDNSVVLPIDYFNDSAEDIIAITTGNIFYYDDGFTNSNAQIDGRCINPCAGVSTVKMNESIRITVTPLDVDDDKVQARAYVYYNHPTNEQSSNWTSLVASGSTITLPDFKANLTGNNFIIRIEVRDSTHTLVGDYEEIVFSVDTSGVEFGDCENCLLNQVEAEEEAEADDLEIAGTSANDSIHQTVEGVSSILGGMSAFMIWLLFMGALAYFIWTGVKGESAVKLGVIGIVEIIALIIGTVKGYIDVWVVISIIVVAVAILGIYIRRLFTGHAGEGG